MTQYGKVCLRRGEDARIRAGADWIYDNELDWADDICRTGDVVDVLDSRMRFVARGFFSLTSKIAVRVLTRDEQEEINEDFFRARLSAAIEFRRRLGFDNSFRAVFGESDGLPGLTVDKYGDFLSFQIVSAGMEQRKDLIVRLLAELLRPEGIYERDELAVREKEGLALQSGCVYGSVPERHIVREHDAKMYVSIPNGQKTGHFLDQQENRGRIRPYCAGADVLDLCCCTGGFSIHAALYGAKSVEAVDVSESALALVRENAALNGVEDKITTTCANVFDLARAYAAEGRQFDLVICDPPAFAKSRQALPGALRGYKELNLRAIQMTRPGGILVSCSCSQFLTPELMLRTLRDAAGDSGRRVRLLETLMQSRDHPASLTDEASLYLKGYILQIL